MVLYRNDDYAATFAGATNVSFVSNQFNISGIIERNTDQDMIKFHSTFFRQVPVERCSVECWYRKFRF